MLEHRDGGLVGEGGGEGHGGDSPFLTPRGPRERVHFGEQALIVSGPHRHTAIPGRLVYP